MNFFQNATLPPFVHAQLGQYLGTVYQLATQHNILIEQALFFGHRQLGQHRDGKHLLAVNEIFQTVAFGIVPTGQFQPGAFPKRGSIGGESRIGEYPSMKGYVFVFR